MFVVVCCRLVDRRRLLSYVAACCPLLSFVVVCCRLLPVVVVAAVADSVLLCLLFLFAFVVAVADVVDFVACWPLKSAAVCNVVV